MASIYFFTLNIFVKYFAPGIVTKFLPVLALVLLLIVNRKKSLNIQQGAAGYFLFGLICFFGSAYSVSPMKGLMFTFSFFVSVLFVSNAITLNVEWRKILIFSSVMCPVLTTGLVIQLVNPNLHSLILSFLPYSSEEVYLIHAWAKYGWLCGFFPERAPAAFFSSMLCGCGLYYLLNITEKKKIKLYGLGLYVFGICGILLSAKRGLLLGMLIATVVCYIVNRKALGKQILIILIALFSILAVGYFIILNLSISEGMINRITKSEDIFTHRLDIYSNILKSIKKHFLLGTGSLSADAILGVGGHNIYLTVLMENGIVGVVVFIYVWFSELIRCIKNIFLSVRGNHQEYIALFTFSLFIQCFFVIYGMSGNPLYDNYILYFYFLGVLLNENSIYRIQKENSRNNNIS